MWLKNTLYCPLSPNYTFRNLFREHGFIKKLDFRDSGEVIQVVLMYDK